MRISARLLLLLTLLCLARMDAFAADPGPAMSPIYFSGRWDMRTPDRAVTVNPGSYLLAFFRGKSIDAHFDLSLNKAPFPTLAWRIDEGAWQEAEIGAKMKLADKLPKGPHRLWLMVRGLDEHQSRWFSPLVASVTFLGLNVSKGALLPTLEAWEHPKLKIEFLGDSITEGVLVQAGRPPKTPTGEWTTDALHSYAAGTAMLLGAQWRQVGFGAQGLVKGGNGKAPGALDAFNFFYDGVPRDDWQPDLVVINQGTNESKMAKDAYMPLYARYLAMIRKAYPKAKIVALRPFGGFEAEGIEEVVDGLRADGDTNLFYLDTTGWYPTGPLHPNAAANAAIAVKLAEALQTIVLMPTTP